MHGDPTHCTAEVPTGGGKHSLCMAYGLRRPKHRCERPYGHEEADHECACGERWHYTDTGRLEVPT